MFRLLLILLFFLFLPMAIYRLYLVFFDQDTGKPKSLSNTILFMCGAVLAFVAMIMFGLAREDNRDKTYYPAEYKDGELIPPRME